MSHLNWIIQRSTDGDREMHRSGYVGNWRDCHSTATEQRVGQATNHDRGITYDKYGNKGFQCKKKARAEIERLRKKFPGDSYRLIKITE